MVNKLKNLCDFQKISEFLLCLFVIFVIFPVKFLIFDSAIYQSGEFSPFLSHFFYLSDVCFLLALLFCVLSLFFGKNNFLKREDRVFDMNLLFLCSALVFFVVFSVFFSINLENSLVYVLRFFEFFIVYLLLVSDFVSPKKLIQFFLIALLLSSLIGILQFIFQHSLGLHFLGESILSGNMVGVAKLNIFGFKLLRIYGTFSHPNIFAAYLLMGIILTYWLFKTAAFNSRKLIIIVLAIFATALFLTFSKAIFIALISILFFLFRGKLKGDNKIILPIILTFLLILLILSETTILERLRFIFISFNLFIHKPFGVGIGNFTDAMPLFSFYKLLPWNFQPVHNTFLLILNEIGLQGLIVFLLIFIYLFYENIKAKNVFSLALILGFFWMAFFDHYLFSLYQGQFLFWFILSRLCSR